jgi:drug/metabolite transporter superfamily protein YnfA
LFAIQALRRRSEQIAKDRNCEKTKSCRRNGRTEPVVLELKSSSRVGFHVLEELMHHAIAWLIFIGAATLEVGGDAIVRRGLRGGGVALVVLGAVLLGLYGVLVNMVPWDFSRLLGVYVAVFAVVSILAGKYVFGELIPLTTWIGLAIIVVGGLCIQFGPLISGKPPVAS